MNALMLSLSLLGLLGSISPVALASTVSSSDDSQETMSDPVSSSLSVELSDMGVVASMYPQDVNGNPQFLNLVEWAYTNTTEPSENYSLYLYIYNPSQTKWQSTAEVSLGFPGISEEVTSISYNTYNAYLVDHTDNYRFLKFGIDGSSFFSLVSAIKRRYVIGQVSLTNPKTSATVGISMGKEVDFTGYPSGGAGDGSDDGSLEGSISDVDVVRVDATQMVSEIPFLSSDDMGQTWNSWWVGTSMKGETYADLFSTVFALPEEISKYGDLESIHYSYKKYRTSWIAQISDFNIYNNLSSYKGKTISSSSHPTYGMEWTTFPFDSDDLPTKGLESVDGKAKGFHVYNNYKDTGHAELRTDKLSWVLNSNSIDGSVLSGQDLLDYLYDYSKGTMSIDGGDGRSFSSDLLYVPDYSFDDTMESVFSNSYFRYGSNERTTSSSDLTVSVWDDFIEPLAFGALGSSSGDGFIETYSDMVKEEILSTYPEYSGIIGTSDALGVLDPSYDPFYQNMTETYSSDVDDFISEHSDENLYRLTYASGVSSSYTALSGKSTSYDGNWSDEDKVAMAKTDVVLGFKFIDLTFKDSDNVLYTLPAAMDSLDSSGDVHNHTTDDDGMPLWEIVLICVAVVVGMFVLGFIGQMYPMVKDLAIGLFHLGLRLVEIVLWVPYLVLVYPVRKLTAKGAYVPLWPFGKR